jgi:hypothetical protein
LFIGAAWSIQSPSVFVESVIVSGRDISNAVFDQGKIVHVYNMSDPTALKISYVITELLRAI